MDSSVMIENVEEMIQMEKYRRAAYKKAPTAFFDEYQELDAIYDFIDDLAASYPNLVSTFVLGTTYEGRQIRGIKIQANRGSKGEFFYNGGIHSREWISPATVLYMANELVTKYGRDANVTYVVDNLDWTIVPVLNPDGYVYTFDGDCLWRKNRQPNSGSICVGTDLNRNWPFQWNTGGSSANPCSDSYHGPSANSGPETKAATTYLANAGSRLKGYIDFHAYSQLLMFSWGYTTQLTADHSFLSRVGTSAANALTDVYGTDYDVGSIANIIYVASGSSADYTYGQLKVKSSFAFELRDKGRYGFLLPPDQIIPSGIETFEALKVLAIQGALSSE
jgi:murein tripeptide amidase MpaA